MLYAHTQASMQSGLSPAAEARPTQPPAVMQPTSISAASRACRSAAHGSRCLHKYIDWLWYSVRVVLQVGIKDFTSQQGVHACS